MRSSARGFTLIELMVVVTLAALLLGLGVPSFTGFIATQRVKTAASDFSMAAVLARSEAIKRNVDATVTAVSSGAAGWKDGWTVAAGGTQLSSQPAYSGLTFAGPTTAITYQSSGRLSTSVTGMTITGSSGNAVRCVSFDLSGLPKSQQGACT
jgi:type IV fimbrial biogenesis protein FimT